MAARPHSLTARVRANVARLNGGGRVAGIDLARGLAMIGMFAAHMLLLEPWSWRDPTTWGDIANGRSSILFATVAGVSLALVTGGSQPHSGARLRRDRLSPLARAGIIWAIGVVLAFLPTPIFVILPAYAVLFAMSIPLLGARRAVLGVVAGIAVVAGPLLVRVVDRTGLWTTLPGSLLDLAVAWHYPFVVWIAFIACGMIIGRLQIDQWGVRVRLLCAGCLAMAVGGAADALSESSLASAEPHGSGYGEVFGSGGLAVVVIVGCLAVADSKLTWVVFPIRAVGSMPLTAYCVHIVAWALWPPPPIVVPSAVPFVPATLAVVLGATAWALAVGRGPLEWLLAAIAGRIRRRGP